MRPVDPRLLRAFPEVRQILAGLGVVGIGQGLIAVGQALAVSHLVVAVVASLTSASTASTGSGMPSALAPETASSTASGMPWGHLPLAPLGWVALVFALRAGLGAVAELGAARAGIRVSAGVRERLLARWLARPLDDAPDPNTATTLATQGVTSIEPYVARFLPAMVGAVVLPVFVVVTIATLDWVSALIVVLTVPLLPVFAALIGKATEDQTARRWRAMASLSGHFLDVVRGLPTLVSYGRAWRQAGTIREVSERHRAVTVQTLRLAFLSSAALELLASISVAIVAVTVGLRLTNGTMELAPGLVCILLAPEAYWPIRRVGAEYHAAADGVVALGEALDELTEPIGQATPMATHADPRPELGRPVEVALQGLSYRYPGTSADVISGLDLTLSGPGLVAVTGESGAGKSTLLDLIAGLRSPSAGRVSAPQAHLVSQRPLLIAGTVRANLLLGHPTRAEGTAQASPQATDVGTTVGTDAEPTDPGLDLSLWSALRSVGLDGDIRELPDGLDTVLGDDGFGLSAGQRARLALARALLSPARVIRLDEPTAHLDEASVAFAHQTIWGLARTRLVIAVTHRPQLLDLASRVVEIAPNRPGLTPPQADPLTRAHAGEVAISAGNDPESSPIRHVDVGAAAAADQAAEDPFAMRAPGIRRAAVIGGLASASGIALTATSGWLIVAASHQPVILTLLAVIVSVRTFGIARPVLRYVERVRSHDSALDLLVRRRVTAYRALIPLTPARLGRRARTRVLTGVVEDLEDHTFATVRVTVPVLGAAVAGLLAVVGLGVFTPAGALVVAGVLVLQALVHRLGRRLELAGQRDWLTARADTAQVSSLVTGYAGPLRGVGAATQALGWVRSAHEGLARTVARLGAAKAVSVALSLVVTALGTLVAALVAAWAMTLGLPDAVAAVAVLTPLAVGDALVGMPDAASAWARARGSEDRLRSLLSQRPAVVDPVGASIAPDVPSGLDVAEGVTGDPFRHSHRPAGGRALATPGTARSLNAGPSELGVAEGDTGDPFRHTEAGPADGIPELELQLELRGVAATWGDPGEPLDLPPVDLTIPIGQHVVLTGANGSGKSTLLAVLARTLDPAAGSYRLGGVDVREVSLDTVRELLAIVDDEPHVFASTLRENLRLAAPDADDPALITGLTAAGLGPWLAGLDQGLDTLLGVGGRGVSGGERARLAIARAHVSGRPIVLLDEPVAHLDHATAVDVLASLRAAFAGRTVVMVSHRPDGVEGFDRVVDLATLRSPLPSA